MDSVTGVLIVALAAYFAGLWLAHYAKLGRAMFFSVEMNDFGRFYYATLEGLAGGDLYGPNKATLVALSPTNSKEFLNLNPPHFHVLLLPLVAWPPAIALVLWIGLNVAALWLSIRIALDTLRVTPSWRGAAWVTFFVLAMCGPNGALVYTGQLTLPLTLLLTVAWKKARDGSWEQAAPWLAVATSIKPFLAVLFLPMLLERNWRALAYAALAGLACVAAGVLAFGVSRYVQWFEVLGDIDWSWVQMNMSLHGWASRTFGTSLHFVPLVDAPGLAQPVWMVGTAAITGVTIFLTWRAGVAGFDHGFALLLLMGLLVSPLGWVYYLHLALAPLTAIGVSVWRRATALPGRPIPNRLALGLVGLGFACPVTAIPVLTNSGWVSVGLGSIYFWAALGLWLLIARDLHQRLSAEAAHNMLVFSRR